MKKNWNCHFLPMRGKWLKSYWLMRNFIILFFALNLSALANGLSQEVSLARYENATLIEVFEDIKVQTGYGILYKIQDINPEIRVDMNVENTSVQEILGDALEGTDLDYKVQDGVIVIFKAEKSNQPEESDREQEKRVLKGTVTDADGNTLPGVSVVVKGTTNGVATDIDGNYNIKIEGDNAVLVFSFVGMISQEIAYRGQVDLNVVLKYDTANLDEVVVTGYQTLSRERATGAFEKVNAVVLEEKSSVNILDKLEGQTAGVLFDKDGNVEIRGRSTLFANQKPLIVVDGFPIEGDMETINPNDIESITVLKDAAAASIWGARAANGVIVIVSKRGTGKGKTNIEFTSSLSLTQKPDLYDLPFASTESFLEAEKFLANNKYTNLPVGANQYPLTVGMDAFLKLRDGIYTQEQTDAVVNGLKNTDVRDEFSDLFLRKAVRQQYSLAISGNSERNSYYASVNYDDNQSYSKQSANDRIISNLSLNSKLNDRLTVNVGINATIRNQKNNGIGLSSITSTSQYQKILDENGNYVNQPKGYYQDFKENLVDQGYPYDWDYNLKREFDNKDNYEKDVDLKLKVGFNYKILEGLDFDGRYQYEWGDNKGRNLNNEETYYVRNFVNYRTVIEDGEIVSYVPKGSILGESYKNYKAFTTRGQLNFNKSFNNNLHNITAMAGIEVRKFERESSKGMKKYGYDPQSLQYKNINLNEGFPNAVSGRKYTIGDNTQFEDIEDRFISYYGNMAYTYAEKYTLTASARLDDSNLFGADSEYRNVPLWSLGGNWQIHKEDFFDFDFINQLSLRATYGLNGNVDKTTSPYMIALVAKDYNTQNQFAYVNNPSNPKLRWERTSVTNLGLDFSMFRNRLSGSIEYYNKYSDGLLGFVSLNSTYGFSEAKMNVAEISNKGLDFSLNALAIDKAFKWNVGLNFSHNKNVVKEIEMPDETPSSYLSMKPKVGLPYAYMYSYKWAGLSSEGLPQVYDQNGDIVSTSDAIEDADALKYEGTRTPKFYGSVINNFAYKGISLRLLMTYKLGHVFRRNTLNYRNFTTSTERNWIHEDYEKRWQNPGDELTTDVPVFPGNSSMLSSYFDAYTSNSSNTVLDASHIRIKEVILSYDMPAKIIKPLSLSKLKFSVQARNLGVIVFNSQNIDPENIPDISNIATSGGGILNQPEFTFSLKGTF